MVKFDCDPGYVLTGERRRWCYDDGDWNWAENGDAQCIRESNFQFRSWSGSPVQRPVSIVAEKREKKSRVFRTYVHLEMREQTNIFLRAQEHTFRNGNSHKMGFVQFFSRLRVIPNWGPVSTCTRVRFLERQAQAKIFREWKENGTWTGHLGMDQNGDVKGI